jgi:uncharacterized membrane protein
MGQILLVVENNMRNIITVLVILLVLCILFLWLFFPRLFPFLANIWSLLGKPEFLGRLSYLAGFIVFIFILSARLLKRGPL